MNKDRREFAHEILDMRLNGMTYQAIADVFGCSKQNIEQCLRFGARKRKRKLESVYPGLKKFVSKEFRNLKEFSFFIYKNYTGDTPSTGCARKKLDGVSSFSIPEIISLIERSGKPFEYLFLMTEEEVEEYDRNGDV